MTSNYSTDCPSGNQSDRAQPRRDQALNYAEMTPAQIEYWRVYFQYWEVRDPEWMRTVRGLTASHANGVRVHSPYMPLGWPEIASCNWDEVIRAQIVAIVDTTPPNPAAVMPARLSSPRRANTHMLDDSPDRNAMLQHGKPLRIIDICDHVASDESNECTAAEGG